jgi:hypothetical protein
MICTITLLRPKSWQITILAGNQTKLRSPSCSQDTASSNIWKPYKKEAGYSSLRLDILRGLCYNMALNSPRGSVPTNNVANWDSG